MSQDPNCEKYYYSIFGRLGQIITTIVRAQRVYAKLFPVATSTTETAAKLDRVKAGVCQVGWFPGCGTNYRIPRRSATARYEFYSFIFTFSRKYPEMDWRRGIALTTLSGLKRQDFWRAMTSTMACGGIRRHNTGERRIAK